MLLARRPTEPVYCIYPDRYLETARHFLEGFPGRVLYGPTCDSSDVLPGQVDLPKGIATGDYLEFSNIGAYSLSGRTDFNGHFSD